MWRGEKNWTTLKPHCYVAHMISVSLLHELSFDCEASLNKYVTDRLHCVPQPHCCRVGQATEKGVEFKSNKGHNMFAFQKGLRLFHQQASRSSVALCSTFNLISSALSFRWGWKSNTRQRTGPHPSSLSPYWCWVGCFFFPFFPPFFMFCLFFVFFCLDTTRKRVNSWSHDRGYGRSPIRLCPFHWSRTGTGQRSAGGWVGGNSNILHRQSIWKVFLM